MDFGDTFGVLWRRKGLTAALLIATLFGASCAFVLLPSKYSASITQTLLNSKQSSDTLGGGNPYLSFDSAMVDMANLLAMELTSNANTLMLRQNGYTASFQAQVLSQNPETEEPFIQISVEGGDKESVAQALQGTTASLRTLLTQVQANVSAKSRLSLMTIAEVSTPTSSLSSKIKPIVGFLAVGLLLTFLVPQAVEGSAARRRKIQVSASPTMHDRPISTDLDANGETGRTPRVHAADTRYEGFEQRWPDQPTEKVLQERRATHARREGDIQPRSGFGGPGTSRTPYSQSEPPWSQTH
jgi:capsular polysaccharide biosynthesis protein